MKFKSNSFRTIWSSLLIGFILIPLTGWAQTPIPIQCGQTVMGSFSTPDQKNSYSFSGTAGDSISIFVKEPGSNTFTPTIRLVSPGEEEIGFGWGDLHATLPASGVYRVEVTFSLAEAGSYFLVWQRWNNPCGTSIVNCGQVVKASIGGTVDAPPWRFYSLEGLAGDRMTIFAYGGDGSGQAEIQVKDSQGNSMGFFYEKFDITLPTSGTYHFWIMSMTDQGDYSVTWQRWNNPCNATPLSCGQTLSGSLIVAGQHNFYTFTATGGDTINIHLARTSGTMIPYIQLIDSTGTQIDLGIGYVGSVDIEKMLPTGGTYIIEVSDDGDQRVGGYKLKVQRNNNSCPEVVLTAPNGSEILKSGSNFMITWTSTNPGTISSQEIRLSKDGGLTFPTLIATDLPGNAQSFDWTLSTDMATPRGRIRVTINSASGSVYDDSDADFAILQYAPRVSRTYVYPEKSVRVILSFPSHTQIRLLMLMETLYNFNKTLPAEPSLKRNIVPNAKRSENFTPLPWRAQSDSLWGHLPYPSVLQETEVEMVFAKTGSFPSAFQLLSSRRSDPGDPLCFDCGHPPFEQDQDSTGQRCFSADRWFKEVPLCQQFEAIPQTNQSQGHSEHHQSSRPVQAEDVLFTQTSDQPSVRFRFFCSHPLW